MNHSEDHRTPLLREQLDRLASSVSAGSGMDGAQLYRQSLRRRRAAGTSSLIAAATAVVLVGGATWLPGADDDGAPHPQTDQRCSSTDAASGPGVGSADRAVRAGHALATREM